MIEPAADLPIALAIAGAELRRALGPATAAVGEVGLGGEVRAVPQMEARLREAARLGYTRLLVPRGASTPGAVRGIDVVRVATIGAAMEHLDPLPVVKSAGIPNSRQTTSR